MSSTCIVGEQSEPAVQTTDLDGVAVGDRVCAALARVLQNGADVHRCQAAQALGRIGHPDSVEHLVAALLDEDEDVRTDAVSALARLAPAEAAGPLLKSLLGDPCMAVKLSAVDALARLRHPELASWLRRMLRGRDAEINWDESGFYENGWDDWVDVQVRAIKALGTLGAEEAVPDIVATIDDEMGQDLTEVGFKALAKLGGAGVEALSRYLAAGDERRRRRAATVLAGSDNAMAREAVARALGDPSTGVRLAVLRALAATLPGDPRLVSLFSDGARDVRAEAVRLCGRHHPACLPALLTQDDPVVLGAVFQVVANSPEALSGNAVTEAAQAALRGPDPDLAAGAALALAAAAPKAALGVLIEQLENAARPLEARLGAIRALVRIGGQAATDALAAVLGDDKRQVRLEAMAALATLAAAEPAWPNRPGETLLAALRGELVPEPEPKAETTEAERSEAEASDAADTEEDAEPASEESAEFPKSTLQSIVGAEAPPIAESQVFGAPVELTQQDLDRLALAARTPRKRVVPVTPQVAPHQDVRQFAARVLGDLAVADVARELAGMLREGDPNVRRIVVDSLARIADRLQPVPDEAIEALLEALLEADRDVGLGAVRALGSAGGAGTARVLRSRLGDDDCFIRAEAVRALSRLGAAGPEVAALLDDPDPSVRLAAAQAVAERGDPGAITLLGDFAFAFEGYHRREVGRMLRRLDPVAASAHMVKVLGDQTRIRVWSVAIEALEEINRTDLQVGNGSAAQPIQIEGAEV